MIAAGFMTVTRTRSLDLTPNYKNAVSSMVSALTVRHQSDQECGFASTDATFSHPNSDKLYWHKGKGALSCIHLKQEKEQEFSDVITSRLPADTENDFIRKMETTLDEEHLLVLDSDFITFNFYNLKQQARYKTIKYVNDQRRLEPYVSRRAESVLVYNLCQ